MPGSPESHFGRPAGGVIRLSDFAELGALFCNWQGRLEQISSGRFEGSLRVVSGRLVRLTGITANQRIFLQGHDSPEMFSVFPVTTGNCGSLWQGRRLTPGQLVLDGPDAETNHYSARRTDYGGMSLNREALLEAARTLLATDAVTLPKNWTVLSPAPEGFARISRQFSLLLNRGVADPSLMGTSEGGRLEQECVRSIIDAVFSTAGPQPDLPLAARSRLFRRAEDFMRSHLGDPVGAIDLCRELGVSDRNLRLTFRERLGLGPMVYYKCLRLNAVRSRLQSAPVDSIANVARLFGFHHLGNFAADYRRLFGVRPSETPWLLRGQPTGPQGSPERDPGERGISPRER